MHLARESSDPSPPLRGVSLHVLAPLAAGSLAYLLGRPTGLRVFVWLEALGLSLGLARARDVCHHVIVSLPAWIVFSLPNALWVYAFAWLLSACWDHRASRQSAPWLLVAPALGVGWELGQLAGLVRGTFDVLDLGLVLVASALALRKPLAHSR